MLSSTSTTASFHGHFCVVSGGGSLARNLTAKNSIVLGSALRRLEILCMYEVINIKFIVFSGETKFKLVNTCLARRENKCAYICTHTSPVLDLHTIV